MYQKLIFYYYDRTILHRCIRADVSYSIDFDDDEEDEIMLYPPYNYPVIHQVGSFENGNTATPERVNITFVERVSQSQREQAQRFDDWFNQQ